MWISDFAIRKPVVTTVVMLALVVFGTIALVTLDTDEFPEVNPPVISVVVPYPGASPANVERDLITPLEDQIATITGADEINSTATDGFGVLVVFFSFDKDLQQASQDIRDEISEIRRDLPPQMEEPVLTRLDPQDFPIVSLTLSSDTRSPSELTRIADPGLTGELRAIPGVADVTIVGGVERELTVLLRPDAMQATGVGVAEVVAALQRQNLSAPVGRLETEVEERTIRLRGRLEHPIDFEQLVIARRGDQVIRLGSVATVRDGTEEPRTSALFDGNEAVGIEIKKATNASTTAVSQRIRDRADALRAELPENVELDIVRDAGVRVADSVRDVQMSLIEGAALTVAVVFVFLMSWRSTVITGLALPVSVLASFIAVWAFGFTLNTMSLLGLSLAIGILIDDAIVVRENIVRHMEMGKDHVTAAREGTSEIGLAVAATTFSIVVVFVPIAFMGGLAQQWLGPFALTLAASVLVSLFVAFSLDPMLSAAWADPELEEENRTWLSRRVAPFNRWLERRTEGYRRTVSWALRHRLAMIALALVTFAAALAMPALGIIGSQFFPPQDRSEFILALQAPPGSSLAYTRERVEELTDIALDLPEVEYVYATVGGEAGQGVGVDEGRLDVHLVPRSQRDRDQDVVASDLSQRAEALGGINTWVANQFGNEKQIQVQVTGPNLETLSLLASRIQKIVAAVPGAVGVGLSSRGQKRELDVVLDRELAGALGVSAAEVAQALRPAFAGIDVGDWVDPSGETRDVEVRLVPGARTSPADVENLPLVLPTPAGDAVTIPLGQIADIQPSLGPVRIDHLDRKRVITVGANVEDRPLSAVISDLRQELNRIELPPGYDVTQGGETEDQSEVFGRILVSLAVALMLMYLILVVQFNSFLAPVAIMASLPLSLIGVVLALLVTGSTLNLMSMIGVVLLMGIVAKNAILLIDFAKRMEGEGMPRKEAIATAGATRLRPILMTSLAIIAGMTPVAIGFGEGAEFRAPLGRAVIGGIITSTLLTLLVIPTFYEILLDARDWVHSRIRRREGGVASEP